MEIKLNKTYRIIRDPHCFQLQQKSKGSYVTIGYYSSVTCILVKLVDLHLIGLESATDLAREIRRTCKELTEAVARSVKDEQ